MNQAALKLRLAIFMFLQYFIWGSWYASLSAYLNHLNFTGDQIGAAYGAFAIGSIISPFFVGLIADRYFASERLLAVLGIAGAVLLALIARFTVFSSFYPLLIVYCALYAPTLALGNSLSLHHLANPKTDFPQVKTLSAVGWIAGGVTLSLLKGEESPVQFYLAAGGSLALGLFSLTLPHTPPRKTGANVSFGEIIGLDALALLKKRSFAIFIVCIFLVCVPLYFYFVMMSTYLSELGWTFITGRMSLAQVSDIVFLVLLPVMLRGLGYKRTIAIGIVAWGLRYSLLAGSVGVPQLQAPLIFGAILLHGVCYDFLFIAGQLYADDEANERMRSAVQGFMAFILWGVGSLVGTHLAGHVLALYQRPEPATKIAHDWQTIWLIPAFCAAAVLLVFMIFFRDQPARRHEDDLIAGRAEENLEVP